MVLAMIEAANMIYLKQALTSAAQISVRAIIEKDAITDDAQQACREFLENRLGLSGVHCTRVGLEEMFIELVGGNS